MEENIFNEDISTENKIILEKKGLILLDKGLDLVKTVLVNNASIITTIGDSIKTLGYSFENSVKITADKELTMARDRNKIISDTQEKVFEELNKDNLSESERLKLIGVLEKATPSEEGIIAIDKGTSVAKTLFAIVGAITLTALVLNRKKKN